MRRYSNVAGPGADCAKAAGIKQRKANVRNAFLRHSALLKYVLSAKTGSFARALLISFFAAGRLTMRLLGRIRGLASFVLAGILASTACAETIHLKNGRTIFADSVRELNGRVEYSI